MGVSPDPGGSHERAGRSKQSAHRSHDTTGRGPEPDLRESSFSRRDDHTREVPPNDAAASQSSRHSDGPRVHTVGSGTEEDTAREREKSRERRGPGDRRPWCEESDSGGWIDRFDRVVSYLFVRSTGWIINPIRNLIEDRQRRAAVAREKAQTRKIDPDALGIIFAEKLRPLREFHYVPTAPGARSAVQRDPLITVQDGASVIRDVCDDLRTTPQAFKEQWWKQLLGKNLGVESFVVRELRDYVPAGIEQMLCERVRTGRASTAELLALSAMIDRPGVQHAFETYLCGLHDARHFQPSWVRFGSEGRQVSTWAAIGRIAAFDEGLLTFLRSAAARSDRTHFLNGALKIAQHILDTGDWEIPAALERHVNTRATAKAPAPPGPDPGPDGDRESVPPNEPEAKRRSASATRDDLIAFLAEVEAVAKEKSFKHATRITDWLGAGGASERSHRLDRLAELFRIADVNQRTEDTIVKAYREWTRQVHPDRNAGLDKDLGTKLMTLLEQMEQALLEKYAPASRRRNGT